MSLRNLLAAGALVLLLAACSGGGGGDNVRNSSTGKTKNRAAAVQIEIGRQYMDRGNFETAHEALEKALKLDPDSVDANTLMAVLYERINRAPGAEKYYRRAAELDPEDGSTNNNFGAFLCRLQRFDEAEKYFLKALDDPFYKTPQTAYSNAGVCAARAGDVAKAESYFRKSLEADPKDAGALYEMALISYKKNDLMRARAFIQRFESINPPDASALDLALQIESRLGDTTAAAKYRERLKSEFPDYEPGTVTGESNSP